MAHSFTFPRMFQKSMISGFLLDWNVKVLSGHLGKNNCHLWEKDQDYRKILIILCKQIISTVFYTYENTRLIEIYKFWQLFFSVLEKYTVYPTFLSHRRKHQSTCYYCSDFWEVIYLCRFLKYIRRFCDARGRSSVDLKLTLAET